MNGYYFEVPPKSYIISVGSGYCAMGVASNTADFWILGDIFLLNYYTSFDDDKGTITLAPSKGSAVQSINTGSAPAATFSGIN